MDTPSSGAGSYLAAQALRGRGLDDSDSESEIATPQIPGAPQTMVSKAHSVSSSGSESDDEDTEATPKHAQVPGSPASGSESGSEVKGHVIEKRVVIATESGSESGSESDSEAEEDEEEQARDGTQEAEKQVL